MLIRKSVIACAAAVVLSLGAAVNSFGSVIVYSQGFETNNSGWDVFGSDRDADRTISGVNGINAASGGYYGVANGPHSGISPDGGSAVTNWGGYSSNFGYGFTTSLDIFLKFDTSFANDTRFDWDNAINKSDGNFMRDFAFNAGYYNNLGASKNEQGYVISASNNANRNNAYPKNPGRDPFIIMNEGWYTFQTEFYDNGSGVLAADLSILNSGGTTLHTWTLSNPADLIANTGGNRYGWFVQNEFQTLGIDNATLSVVVPEPASIALLGLGGLALLARRRRRSIA